MGTNSATLEAPIVDPEFKSLIPPLALEELRALEENLARDGCRDPLVTWNGVLLDGHNRIDICRRLDLPFRIVAVDLPDRGAAILWIIRNQLGRRNLAAFQRAELALRMESIIAEKARENQGTRTDIRPNSDEGSPTTNFPQNSAECRSDRETRSQVARLAGVSHDTIHKAKVLVDRAPEPLKEQLRSGEVSIHAAYQQVRQGVHYSSATSEWETPQDLFDVLHAEFSFTTDVCATRDNTKCPQFYSAVEDGLAQPWSGVCWMNPPYGDEIALWMRKALDEAHLSDGPTVVCLVPARVDTEWWWDTCRHGEIRFLRGRLRFGGAAHSAPFPSAIVIFPRVAVVRWWEWQR